MGKTAKCILVGIACLAEFGIALTFVSRFSLGFENTPSVFTEDMTLLVSILISILLGLVIVHRSVRAAEMGDVEAGILTSMLFFAMFTFGFILVLILADYDWPFWRFWSSGFARTVQILLLFTAISTILAGMVVKPARNHNTVLGILAGLACFLVLVDVSECLLSTVVGDVLLRIFHLYPAIKAETVEIALVVLYTVVSAILGFDVARKSERAEVTAFILVWFIVLALTYSYYVSLNYSYHYYYPYGYPASYQALIGLVWFIIFFAAVSIIYYLKRTFWIKKEPLPDIRELLSHHDSDEVG